MKTKFYLFITVLFVGIGINNTAFAQLKEPEVIDISNPKTPLSEGFRNSISFDVMLNNFGFGIGGNYSRVIGPFTEITLQAGITGLRDVSEQTFQNFFTGQQIVPNKYKRGFGFPILIGLKQRLFAQEIDDNFRLFVSGAMGPAAAFVYPYVDDDDNNGFRTFQITPEGFLIPVESVNDFFTGWSEGDWEWGLNGELTIGVDLGSSFTSQTTVEFGYFFYYFSQGIQMMEPYKPVFDENGYARNPDGTIQREPFFDAQKYFGTPVLKVSFGGMW